MTKEELEIDNKRLDFNEKVQFVVKKEELKEQNIRLNRLCFDYLEKEKRIAELEKENAELKEVHESDKRSLALIAKKGADFEKSYNEAEELLDKQIEATYKLFEENKELKERNKVIDEELLIKQKQLTNAISCLYKSLEVLTKLTEGMRHIAYNHPTMHAHREIMQNLRLAEDYEVELGNILSQGNFGRDEIEVELGKNERRI